MSSNDKSSGDPLEFIKGMWGSMGLNLPGMITPTLDVDELDKRITDLKTVEGWLKMNLNMLTMSIQGLEMQRAALAAVKAMSQGGSQEGQAGAANPFAGAAMNPALNPGLWPWSFMQQQQTTEAASDGAAAAAKTDTGGAAKASPAQEAGESRKK